MKAQDILADQLAFSHMAIAGTIGDCSPSILHQAYEGGTISNVASIYAHMAFTEDFIVNGMLQGKPPRYKAENWESKTGILMPANPAMDVAWTENLRMDLDQFDQYAKEVFSHSETYIRGLSDAELERMVPAFGSERSVGWLLANIIGTHTPMHTGEIAALKGVQGLKGLPF